MQQFNKLSINDRHTNFNYMAHTHTHIKYEERVAADAMEFKEHDGNGNDSGKSFTVRWKLHRLML